MFEHIDRGLAPLSVAGQPARRGGKKPTPGRAAPILRRRFPMLLYRTAQGPVVELEGAHHLLRGQSWDDLLNAEEMEGLLRREALSAPAVAPPFDLAAPIGTQEVWAAGVTYWRSRDARMEESQTAGGGSFYDRVYEAERPELFLKATPHRVVGPGGQLRLRRDARWIVPEPELVLVVNRRAEIVGYTIGNDLSCRDIEGENPLYLPQAKTFDACAALGPGLLITSRPLPPETEIHLQILRGGDPVFAGTTSLSQMRRTPATLVEYLFREASFPTGCFLFTGTGIVPPPDFGLRPADEVHIEISPVGTLINTVG
jgi:2-dehydro-3-deoxy-D-arabinonate dehydratase